jgi:hypothetical protein
MLVTAPLLAAGGSAISILFLVIAFVSWLWNVFNSNKNAAGGARPQPQPGGGGKRVEKELQAEINRFLKNVMGQKDAPQDELEVLVVEEPPPKSRARDKNRNKPTTTASGEGPGPTRPGGRIAQRKGPGSTTLGSGVRQHVADHMQEGRVLQQAQEHLGHSVADKVKQDMGTFSATEAAPAPTSAARPSTTAASVAAMMRDPAGVKQAFVLNLILNRPTQDRRRR